MRFVSEQHIDKISFLYAIIIVGVMTFATGALFIGNKVDTLKKDLVSLEQDFIVEQKEQLKSDISSLLVRIDSRRSRTAQSLQERLEEHVQEALKIAANLYEQMPADAGRETITRIIREAIRPMRFNEKQGYVFILTLEGKAILYPADRSVEGSNFLTNTVGGGPDFTENLIKIAREKGSGFYNYNWTLPGDLSGSLHKKISYVTLFEPLGWVIGTGEYIENLDALARASVSEDFSAIMNSDATDYFFAYELHDIRGGTDFATMLINGNRTDLIGKTISDDYLDAKGKPFRKEFMEGIRANGESFVVYWYKKPDGSGIGRKLSYFKLYPEWNWIIARGIYFDRLDNVIATKKEELSKKVKNDIMLLCLIFLVAVTIALFAAYKFSKELQNIFDRYKQTQRESFAKLEVLNQTLEKQSHTDALTQIYNRGFFNQQLTNETSRVNRYNTPLSMILFDIDHFKTINDTHGHLAGDTVLKELAALIQENTRQSDFYARWGGEEFVVLLPGVEKEKAKQVAEKLRLIIAKFTFSVQQNITCSFGISSFIPLENNNTFLQRVDKALYQAKQGGRNKCVFL
jgi:diguanylate cyclase (GGDEF)-like protein